MSFKPWEAYQYQPDPRLYEAIRHAESGADPSAVSSVGAIGTMQTMPATLRDPGYGVEPLPEDLWDDPVALQKKGEEYFAAMYRKYKGDTEAALIAYNAGPGNADKWLKSGRDYAVLPDRAQTEPYVQKVTARFGGPAPEGPWSAQAEEEPPPWVQYQQQASQEEQAINPDTGQPWTPEEIEATKIGSEPPVELTESVPQAAPEGAPWRQYEQASDAGGVVDKIGDTLTAGGAGLTTGTLNLSGSVWRSPEAGSRYSRGAYDALRSRGVPDWLNPFGAPTLILDKIAKGHDFGKFHAAGTSDVADRIGESMRILNETSPTFKRAAQGNDEAQKALEGLIDGNTELFWAVAKDPEAWASAMGNAIPTLLAAWKSGGSLAFMGWMEAMEAAESAVQFEEETGIRISDAEFAAATAATGAVNSLLEKTGLDAILGKLPGGKSIVGRLIAAMGVEGGTEFMQETVQNATGLIYDDKAVDKLNTAVEEGRWRDAAKQLTEGGLPAAMGGAGVGGGAAGLGVVAERLQAQQEGREPPPRDDLVERADEVSAEEAAEAGIEVRDEIANDVLSRVGSGDPLTDEEMFNLNRLGLARPLEEEGRMALTPAGRRQLAGEGVTRARALDQQIRQSRAPQLRDLTDSELRQRVRSTGDIDRVVTAFTGPSRMTPEEFSEKTYHWPSGQAGQPVLRSEASEDSIPVTVAPEAPLRLTDSAFDALQPEEIEYIRREGFDAIASRDGRVIPLESSIVQTRAAQAVDARGFTPEMKEDFERLADSQRGLPERAMLRVQSLLGGGVLNVMAEHLGDLTHRMAEPVANDSSDQGLEYVKPKVDRGISFLFSPYGFEREHNENLRANFRHWQEEPRYRPKWWDRVVEKTGKEPTFEDYQELVDRALKEYADEHRKLEVWNEAQRVARDIAIALGEQKFERVRNLLRRMETMTADAETFVSYARRHPSLSTPKLSRKRRRRRAPSGEWYQDRYKVRGEKPVGSPPGVANLRDTARLVTKLRRGLRRAEGKETNQRSLVPPESWTWYEEAGALIRKLVKGDMQDMEKMVRLLALMSPNTSVETNVTKWINGLYAAYKKGTLSELTKIPGALMGNEDLVKALEADELTMDLRGVGPKLLNFYRNLWDATFEQDRYPDAVTVDLWMARILGYAKEELIETQYEFARKLIVDITADYNDKYGTSWKPRQMQAALWVMARGGRRGSFAELIRGSSANAAFEAIPTESTNDGRVLARLTDEQRVKYTEEMLNILGDEEGRNELLDALGLPMYVAQQMRGALMGAASPGALFEAPLVKAASEYDRETADMIAKALQYIYRQDSVVWFRPVKGDPKAKATPKPEDEGYDQAFSVQFDKALTSEDIGLLSAMLEQHFPGQGFTVTEPDTVLLINLDGTDPQTGTVPKGKTEKSTFNRRWLGGIENWLSEISTPFGIIHDGTAPLTVESSGYRRTTHDWEADQEGTRLLDDLQARQPNLQQRLNDWRGRAEQVTRRWVGRAKTAPRAAAAPVPLDRLDVGGRSQVEIYGRFGALTGRDTTESLKIYNLRPLIDNPRETTETLLTDYGYEVDTFSYDEERFKLPNFRKKSYKDGWVWIYDPEVAEASFKDVEYTRAWRVTHEIGHGITEDLVEERYGPSYRYGRLGRDAMLPRGKPPNRKLVQQRAMTLKEAQRALEWEDLAFRVQRMLLEQVGVRISDEQFIQEYNTNIADAMYRTITSEFGNPGEYGFRPSASRRVPIRDILKSLQKTEEALAKAQGRKPTEGIDLSGWSPVSDTDLRAAMDGRKAEYQSPTTGDSVTDMRIHVNEDGSLVVKEPKRFSRKIEMKQPKFGKRVEAMMKEWMEGTEPNPLDPRERVIDWKAAATMRPSGKDTITVESLRAFEFRKGDGGMALRRILQLADKHGVTLRGTPKPFGEGGLNKRGLIDWYKRNGFRLRDTAPFDFERKPRKSTRFSRKRTNEGKGLGREGVQAAVRRVYRRMNSAPRVLVIDTVEDLPQEIYLGLKREQDRNPKSNALGSTQGMYDIHGMFDTVYLIGANINTTEEAIDVLLHEIVGHYGTQGVLSTAMWERVMDRIWNSFPDLVRDAAERNNLNIADKDQRRIASEEVIAYYTGQALRSKTVPAKMKQIIEDLVEMFRVWLNRAIGRGHGITKRQIRGIIAEGWNFVHRPGGYKHQVVKLHRNHRYSMYSPWHYSALQNWIKDLPETKKMRTIQQWKEEIRVAVKKGLIKQEEVDWVELEDFIESADVNAVYRAIDDPYNKSEKPGIGRILHLYGSDDIAQTIQRNDELDVEIKELTEKLAEAIFPSQRPRASRSDSVSMYWENQIAQKLADGVVEPTLEGINEAIASHMGSADAYIERLHPEIREERDTSRVRRLVNQLKPLKEESEGVSTAVQEFGNSPVDRVPVEAVAKWVSKHGVDIHTTAPKPDWDPDDAFAYVSEDSPDDEQQEDGLSQEEFFAQKAEERLDEEFSDMDDRLADPEWEEIARAAFNNNVYPDEEVDEDEQFAEYIESNMEDIDEDWKTRQIELNESDWTQAYDESLEFTWQWDFEGIDFRIEGNKEKGEFSLTVNDNWYNDGDWDDMEQWAKDEAREIHEMSEGTKWSSYTLPGSKDYGETLIRWDNNGQEIYQEHAHWDGETNVIVHVRHDIRRSPDGERVFFVDEIQSDWHQEVREDGKKDPALAQRLRDEIGAEVKKYRDGLRKEAKASLEKGLNAMSVADLLDFIAWGETAMLRGQLNDADSRKKYYGAIIGKNPRSQWSSLGRLSDNSTKPVGQASDAAMNAIGVLAKPRLENLGMTAELSVMEGAMNTNYPETMRLGALIMNGLRDRSPYLAKSKHDPEGVAVRLEFPVIEFDNEGNPIGINEKKGVLDGDMELASAKPIFGEFELNHIFADSMRQKHKDAIIKAMIDSVTATDLSDDRPTMTTLALMENMIDYMDVAGSGYRSLPGLGPGPIIQDHTEALSALPDSYLDREQVPDVWSEDQATDLGLPLVNQGKTVELELNERQGKIDRAEQGIDSGPFEKSYHLLALKWALHEANRQGISKVAIANGEVHGFRWGAGTVYDHVEVQSGTLDEVNGQLFRHTHRDMNGSELRDTAISRAFLKAQNEEAYKGSVETFIRERYPRVFWAIISNKGEATTSVVTSPEDLQMWLGPSMARKVLAREEEARAGDGQSWHIHDFDVVEETGSPQHAPKGTSPKYMTGSRAVYNQIQPNVFTNKLLKKYGAKVVWGPLDAEGNLSGLGEGTMPWFGPPDASPRDQERIAKEERKTIEKDQFRIVQALPSQTQVEARMARFYGQLVTIPEDPDKGKYRRAWREDLGVPEEETVRRENVWIETTAYKDYKRRRDYERAPDAPPPEFLGVKYQQVAAAPEARFVLSTKEEYDAEFKALATTPLWTVEQKTTHGWMPFVGNQKDWRHRSVATTAETLLFDSKRDANAFMQAKITEKLLQDQKLFGAWMIEITPKLEEQLKSRGLPLFSRRAPPEQQEGLDELDQKIDKMGQGNLQRFQNTVHDIIHKENKKARFEQSFLDQFAGIRHAIKAYYGNQGLPPELDPYKHAHLTTSPDSQMFVILTEGALEWRDGASQIKEGSKGLLDILEPVGKKIDDWGKFMVARRAKRLYLEGIKEGTGLYYNLRQHFKRTRAEANRPSSIEAMREAAWQEILDDSLPQQIQDQIRNAGREKLLSPKAISSGMWLGEQNPVFEEVATEYAEFMKSMLDWAQTAGVINPETRPLWENADYIPFYRLKDNDLGGGFSESSGVVPAGLRSKVGLVGQRSPISQLRGGTSKLGNPLENIVTNMNMLMQTTMRNNAAVLTIDALDGSGVVTKVQGKEFLQEKTISNSDLKRRLRSVGIDTEDMDAAALNAIQKMWVIDAPKDPNVVTILRNGKKEYWHIHDEVLFRSLTAINQRHFQSLFGSLAMAPFRFSKRLLTTMITLSPAFMGANWLRDGPMAFVNSRYAKMVRPDKSILGIAEALMLSKEMKTMMAAGGAFYSGYINAGDPIATSKAMRRALRQSGVRGKVLNSPVRLAHAYNDVAAAMENSNRIAYGFKPAMSETGSVIESVYESKDLMNFAKHGDLPIVAFFIQTVPFLNARIQGLYRYGRRQMGEGAAAAGVTLLKAMLVLLPTLALYWNNRDDDRYKRLTAEDRDLYWHFWLGGSHYRIPKPFEVGAIFATVPERIWEWMESDADDAGKVALDRLGWVIGEMFNFDLRQIQLINPMVEAARNHNSFFKGSIVPYYLQKVDPRYQYTETTSPTARAIAEVMPYDWPMLPDFIESPMMVEHLMRGYFGTLGGYIMQAVDTHLRANKKWPPLRADQLPVMKRFYRGFEPPIRYDTAPDGRPVIILPEVEEGVSFPRRTAFESMMYDFRRAAVQVEETLRDIREDERVSDEQEDPYLARRARFFRGLTNEELEDAVRDVKESSEEIREYRKEIDETLRDENLTPEQKALRLEGHYRDIQRAAMEWYFERPGSPYKDIQERPLVMFEEQWEQRQRLSDPEIISWLQADYPATAELYADVKSGGMR